ncbi:class I adenylate-forming enzyme family protein [Nonomuraea sp. SBT364]|uniref:class I adenylate-forming enzyme family protein n=1 Tax=Nonomuraea sp. SBT364 TaxID=1580530 RepID=UPI00066A2160|nr:AMP-binding protein [Nonomuraea sp. SBT364]
MLVHDIIDSISDPGRPAVRDRMASWSYDELRRNSMAFSGWLRRRGVQRGDRVLVPALPDRRFLAALFGCSRAGVIFVPVSDTLRPYQRAQIVRDAEPALTVDLAGAWREMSGPQIADAPAHPANTPADPLILFYTSGSTAEPKAVVAPHAQILFAARAVQQRLRYRAEDTIFCRLPLNFDYGLYQIFLAALSGATLVLADPQDDARLAVALRQQEATVVPVVPGLAVMLARLAGRGSPLQRVRLFTNTGDQLPPATINALKGSFPRAAVQLMFGLTECKRVSILEPDGYLARPRSVGTPLDSTSVSILDRHDRPLPAGESGQIVVHGPHVMAGYWRAPELTSRTFGVDAVTGVPFLRTGDIGSLDEAGHLYFHGRRDHIFKLKGVRASVAEIEAAAFSIPGVHEAALVPPAEGGKTVLYAVGSLPGTDILRELEIRLGPQKLPDLCHVLDDMPRGSTGKVDRSALSRLSRPPGQP